MIEHTQIIHNINDATKSNGNSDNVINFIKIPWGAIRKSNLQSVFVENKHSQKLERRWLVHGKIFVRF